MKITIANALPGSLLADLFTVRIEKLSPEQAANLLDGASEIVSAVGHADTARIFSAQLGREVPENRVSLTPEDVWGEGDKATKATGSLLAGLYKGPRLPEGATQLPPGATIQWVIVHPVWVQTGQDNGPTAGADESIQWGWHTYY